jgi:signal transduction histidine kinase
LNVIGLSLRMISQSVPKGDPDLDEDLRFVEENYRQIERMLAQLSDFYRLFENESPLSPTLFSPRRLIEELLEARASKAGVRSGPVLLDVRLDCPPEVELDPARARQAIQYALANATSSSNGDPIRLSMHGGPDRWIIEVAIDKPPPPSVESVTLSSHTFERLCGFAAERRGMDLAIAAKVTELFGGTARLDVIQSRGTNVVFDWPARLKSG